MRPFSVMAAGAVNRLIVISAPILLLWLLVVLALMGGQRG